MPISASRPPLSINHQEELTKTCAMLTNLAPWSDSSTVSQHIARHAVLSDDGEEALVGEPLVRRGPDDRDLADGRTEHGRWVFAVYVTRPRGRIRVLTARDMTGGRLYQRKRRGRS